MQPKLVYDDDCGFCTWAAEFVYRHGEFMLIGFSELLPDQRDRLPPDYKECAHLLTDDRVYSCGEAMEEAFARTEHPFTTIVPTLRSIPGHSQRRETVYRWIANNRDQLGRVLSSEPPAREAEQKQQ